MENKHIIDLTTSEMIAKLLIIKSNLLRCLLQLRKQRTLVNVEESINDDDKKFMISNSYMISYSLGETMKELLTFYDEIFTNKDNEIILDNIRKDEEIAEKIISENKNSFRIEER